MDLVTSSAQSLAGGVVSNVLKLVKDVLKKSYECPYACKRLQGTLEAMIPMLEHLNTGVELSQQNQNVLSDFRLELQEGPELFQNGSKLHWIKILQRYKYTKKIKDLESRIIRFTNTKGWALLYSQGVNLEDKLEKIDEKIDHRLWNMDLKIEEIRKNFDKGPMDLSEIHKLASELSVPELNVPKLQGLGTLFSQVKESLLQRDVPLLGVTGMGGSGKTTLAKALCNDPDVKGYFRMIVFVTVSQSPDIKKLLNRMWQRIVGRSNEFDSIEDVRIQLQKRIRDKEPRSILVVLDDVCKRDHLEKLSFEGEGCKTLITARNKSIVDKPYELPCLRKPDDVSLFCLSAFDEDSIPKTEDEELVNEVIEECKGLPLALKTYSEILSEQP